MIALNVQVNGDKEIARKLAVLQHELPAANERSVAAGGFIVLRELQQRLSGQPRGDAFWGRGGAVGDFLTTRSGKTRQRLVGGQVMTAPDGSAFTSVGSPDRYMLAHETGGRFSTSGFFRIPTAAAQTASGVDRFMGRSIRGSGMKLIRTRTGKLWAVLESGVRAARVTFMYLFVKSIKLPARHPFEGARKDAEPKVFRVFGNNIAATVRRNGGS